MTLSGDEAALAGIRPATLAGSLESARATTPAGRPVPLEVRDGRLTPKVRLTPGEKIDVEVVVRRPGALSWALGDTRREHLTITTPVVHPTSRWVSVPHGSAVTVAYDGAVAGEATGAARRTLRPAHTRVSLGAQPAAGSTAVAVAARGMWERLQPATRISWFPQTEKPAAVSAPAANGRLSPLGTVQLTFAKTVHDAIGDTKPTLTPTTPGRFTRPDSHTLLFTPTGDGFGVGTGTVHMTLPKTVDLVSATGTTSTKRIGWTVPPGSTLRLQQLLAAGGLPAADWTPSGRRVARTPRAQSASRRRPARRALQLALPEHAAPAAGAVERRASENVDHARRADEVRGRKRLDGRRPRRPGGVARAARGRDRRQAPRRRLQLRLRAPRRSRRR